MFKLFKPKGCKSRAMIFIDYESWYYSYKTLYGMRPDPKSFRTVIEKEFSIEDIMVFGDFSISGISEELVNLRTITNTIIETGNTYNRHKKDMTDFIMLDYIYQYVDEHKNIDNYIVFTGDGHFQSVVRYLTQKKKKRVVVYGVRDSISRQLREAATEVRELPEQGEVQKHRYSLIVKNMEEIRNKPHIIPSFMATAEAVSKKYDLDLQCVKEALQEMVDAGYLYRELKVVGFRRSVRVLAADWDKLREAGLWSPKE